jgi:hypothetical protein
VSAVGPRDVGGLTSRGLLSSIRDVTVEREMMVDRCAGLEVALVRDSAQKVILRVPIGDSEGYARGSLRTAVDVDDLRATRIVAEVLGDGDKALLDLNVTRGGRSGRWGQAGSESDKRRKPKVTIHESPLQWFDTMV